MTSGGSPLLAWDEGCLPGETPGERLALARSLDLALEVENRGEVDPTPWRKAGLPIVNVQAWLFHEYSPVARDREARLEAAKHLDRTLDLAARLGSPRVLAVPAYGNDPGDSPFERALEFFARFVPRCRDLGIRITLEPLSTKRTPVLHDPFEVARLADTLDEPRVFSILLDLGHLADGGHDLDAFFRAWNRPVEEIHLKAPGSRPPDPDWPLAEWFSHLPAPPAVACGEHREPIDAPRLRAIVPPLRAALG